MASTAMFKIIEDILTLSVNWHLHLFRFHLPLQRRLLLEVQIPWLQPRAGLPAIHRHRLAGLPQLLPTHGRWPFSVVSSRPTAWGPRGVARGEGRTRGRGGRRRRGEERPRKSKQNPRERWGEKQSAAPHLYLQCSAGDQDNPRQYCFTPRQVDCVRCVRAAVSDDVSRDHLQPAGGGGQRTSDFEFPLETYQSYKWLMKLNFMRVNLSPGCVSLALIVVLWWGCFVFLHLLRQTVCISMYKLYRWWGKCVLSNIVNTIVQQWIIIKITSALYLN